jgi:hypothetical protein
LGFSPLLFQNDEHVNPTHLVSLGSSGSLLLLVLLLLFSGSRGRGRLGLGGLRVVLLSLFESFLESLGV